MLEWWREVLWRVEIDEGKIMKLHILTYFWGALIGAWIGDIVHVLAMIFAAVVLMWILERIT